MEPFIGGLVMGAVAVAGVFALVEYFGRNDRCASQGHDPQSVCRWCGEEIKP
jgi:hypothetical protein